jgi:hypothetical protein
LRGYAILEMAFALGFAFRTVSGLFVEEPELQVLAVLTSAYLMIRAMDNFRKDLDERRKRATEKPPSRIDC